MNDLIKKNLHVFLIFLRLGITSFGGPIAHLAYFHDEFVKKRKWISEEAYADLVALCQFLPGPASSQVGMAIGLSRSGFLGSIMAWLGFTIPSALMFIVVAFGLTKFSLSTKANWLHGLKVVAVAVVFQAILSMGKKLCPDNTRKAIAAISSATILALNTIQGQILILIIAGVFGVIYFKKSASLPHIPVKNNLSKRLAFSFLVFFIAFLFLLPVASTRLDYSWLSIFDSFYRAGSLVFGGGHVVLPLLQTEVVNSGWVSKDLFTVGYGIAQALPGPLFSFSAYLGAVSSFGFGGFLGGILSLTAIFLPSFLLIIGILPFWEKLRSISSIKRAMIAINAAVVGILLAAFYQPIWVTAIFSLKDFLLALLIFIMLEIRKWPTWIVVLLTIALSLFIYR